MPQFETKEDLYQFLDKMVAHLQQDEKLKERIAHTDMSIGFVVTDLGAECVLRLQNGQVSAEIDGAVEATFSLSLSSDTLNKLLSGRLDPESAYMTGAIRLRGSEWVAQTAEAYIPYLANAYRAATSE